MNTHDAIVEGLKPLFAKAREHGLWFHCNYQDLWFSPDELAAEHARGRFLWGAVNWELRNPRDRLMQMSLAAKEAQVTADAFRERLNK